MKKIIIKYLNQLFKKKGIYNFYTDLYNRNYQIIKFVKLIPSILKNYIICRLFFKRKQTKFIAILPGKAIGPMIMFAEYFLRYCIVHNINPRKDIILIAGEKNINSQYLKMLSRVIKIVRNNKLHTALQNGGYHYLSTKPFYIKNDVPKSIGNGHIYFPSAKSFISFTQEENERGEYLLSQLGIEKGKKYVCIHNHSTEYWSSRGINSNQDLYRSSNWGALEASIKLLGSQKLESIRVGFHREIPNNCKSLMILNEEDIQFLDLYIQKNCIFSICGDSGIAYIPFIFKTPILYHNFIPLGESPAVERGIIIPKLIKNLVKNRYMTIKELLNLKHLFIECDQAKLLIYKKSADAFQNSAIYSRYGLNPVENSDAEIEAGVGEMLRYLNGDLLLSKGEMKLQEKFKSLFPIKHPMRRSTNFLVSPSFLEKNEFILH